MSARDLDLLLDAVTAEDHHLTSVDDRCGDRLQGVGGQDEVAVGEIDIGGGLGVLVVEQVILFGVEDLQQGRDGECSVLSASSKINMLFIAEVLIRPWTMAPGFDPS